MRRLIAVPTVLLALAAAGCGTGEDREEAPATASASNPGGASDAPGPQDSPTIPGQPVSCGAIADALGKAHGVALYADPGAGGTVGCDEARAVMKEFFLRAPPQSAGHPGSLAVRGWACQYDGGPTGTWVTECRQGERAMHTEDSGQQPGPSGPPDEPGAPDEPSLPGEPSTTEL
ncbi:MULTISPECIES: hypothetical protein [unclassified Streptomyces]|uniref:hypothetical protein n=1 Tax=unclassified Streptomyces TaxID=2593676 RepID=UPI000373620F|nr:MULTISPECIES: hypothetical protein [unclassified Streptomyces]MYT28812.1 hypothetical protein [Streptomyces sp. SID8354]